MDNPLAEKVGPFPLFVYVGIGVVGILAYHKFHTPAPVSAQTATDAGSTDQSSSGAIDPSTGTVGWTPQFATAPGSAQNVSSNLEWAIAGADYLAGIGVSPQAANAAVNAYVNGQATTPAQQSLIAQIIQYLGNAPEGVINFVNGGTSTGDPSGKPTVGAHDPRHNPIGGFMPVRGPQPVTVGPTPRPPDARAAAIAAAKRRG